MLELNKFIVHFIAMFVMWLVLLYEVRFLCVHSQHSMGLVSCDWCLIFVCRNGDVADSGGRGYSKVCLHLMLSVC